VTSGENNFNIQFLNLNVTQHLYSFIYYLCAVILTSKSIIFRDKLDTFVFAQCVDNKAKEKQLRFSSLLEYDLRVIQRLDYCLTLAVCVAGNSVSVRFPIRVAIVLFTPVSQSKDIAAEE
jgi:hypothetical protein